MTGHETSQLEATLLARRVAKQSALLDAARRSSISRRELIIRLVAFAAFVTYVEACSIDLGGVLFGFTVFFLVLYSRDTKRRERRIDALVELLGFNSGATVALKGSAEPARGGDA